MRIEPMLSKVADMHSDRYTLTENLPSFSSLFGLFDSQKKIFKFESFNFKLKRKFPTLVSKKCCEYTDYLHTSDLSITTLVI